MTFGKIVLEPWLEFHLCVSVVGGSGGCPAGAEYGASGRAGEGGGWWNL